MTLKTPTRLGFVMAGLPTYWVLQPLGKGEEVKREKGNKPTSFCSPVKRTTDSLEGRSGVLASRCSYLDKEEREVNLTCKKVPAGDLS